MFIIHFQGNYHFGIMHTTLNGFPSFKRCHDEGGSFAPPISVLQLLGGLQKTLRFLVTWVNCIMARISCPLQCVHRLVAEKRRNDGNTFPQHPHFQYFCLSSISVLMYGFKKGQYPNWYLYARGKAHVFSFSLRLTIWNESTT